MVSKLSKAIAGRSVPNQTEPSKKYMSVQTSSGMECLSLSVVPGDGAKDACMWYEQVNDLCVVAELKEEVERQKSIRKSEREIDWWSSTLRSLREAHLESEDSHASYQQAEGGDLVDEGEWKWVPPQ